MSFASGLQAGIQNQQFQQRHALDMEQDARARQQHAMQMAALERQARLDAEGDAAHGQFKQDYFGTPPAGAPGPTAPQAGLPVPRGAAPQMSMAPGAPAETGIPAPPQMSRAPAPESAPGAGMPQAVKDAPNPFAVRRQRLDARRRLAVGTRNVQALQALDAEDKAIQTEEIVASVPEKMKDPEYVAEIKRFINSKSEYVTLSETKDKNGRVSMRATLVQPTGDEKNVDLSPAQLMKVIAGHELLKIGNPEGMRMIAEGNKELADALDRQSGRRMDAAKTHADLQGKDDQYEHQRDTRIEQRRHNMAGEKNDSARTQATVNAHRQISPEMAKKLADLEGQYINARTPQEQAEIRRQYDIVSANASAEIGKPRGLPEPRGQMTHVQAMESRAKLKAAGYADEQIEAMVTGYDPIAKIAEMLKARQGAAPAGRAPVAVGGVPESAEQSEARRIQNLGPDAFEAYKAWKEGQPTNPRQRQLLQQAGFQI